MWVGVQAVPEVTCDRAELNADYADRFSISLPTSDRSALDWARLILEETPAGRGAPRLWTAIGVRLGPRPSPDHVQGWRTLAQHPTWARLGAATTYLEARAVVEADDDTLALALFVRYRVPVLGAALWWPISVMHRRGVPVMLQQARARVSRRSPSPADDRLPG
ncbi:DUF2867 domain-containing protein [Iamia sp. SCSIO 61187]|uniref:hypothetical protein n=1 Tax=Iamia sp. SCSIO 61187 TaxID=2722752 RepID=UPI001C6398E2|nr:hypothetical protein [Iamia sp. SCSIO 61187]QYG91726.1 DUF2867 domain-containing protein [Iamia sp. SCSIO 61187]